MYRSLAYSLADAGYDVWLGNARGNTNSKFHSALTPNSKKFWAWSWQDIAEIDIPTMLEYVLATAQTSELNYVGHSQGATAGLAAFALKPDLAAKVKLFTAFAPVESLKESKSMLVNSFKDLVTEQQWLDELGSHEVFPLSKMSTFAAAGYRMAHPLFVLCEYSSYGSQGATYFRLYVRRSSRTRITVGCFHIVCAGLVYHCWRFGEKP